MTDHSLCGSPDRLECCKTCWRNPSHHPYSRDNPWQSYFSPPMKGDGCDFYWPQDNGREAPRVRK